MHLTMLIEEAYLIEEAKKKKTKAQRMFKKEAAARNMTVNELKRKKVEEIRQREAAKHSPWAAKRMETQPETQSETQVQPQVQATQQGASNPSIFQKAQQFYNNLPTAAKYGIPAAALAGLGYAGYEALQPDDVNLDIISGIM